MRIPFSIVIPLYNKAPYISKTLASVLNQDYQDFEIIIVDDGSTDQGLEVVNGFHDRRIKTISQHNQGVSVARNTGIKHAKYDYIAFLDADDEWKANHLSVLARLARSFPEAKAFTTAYQRRAKNGRLHSLRFQGVQSYPWEGIIEDYFKAVYRGPEIIWTSALALDKKILPKIGYFRPGMKRGQDADLWIRVALNYPIAFSWESTAIYNLDSGNFAFQQTRERSDLRSHYFTDWPKLKTKQKSYLNEYIAKKQLILLTELYLSGYRKEVRQCLKSVDTEMYRKEKRRLNLKTYMGSKLLQKIKIKKIRHTMDNHNHDKFV